MGGCLEIAGCVCLMKAARLSMLVLMSSCLDESRSCSGVGPCGRLKSDVASIVCHLVAIGDVCGSWVEDICVEFLGVRVIRFVGVCGSK
jgi:hypothetical protein